MNETKTFIEMKKVEIPKISSQTTQTKVSIPVNLPMPTNSRIVYDNFNDIKYQVKILYRNGGKNVPRLVPTKNTKLLQSMKSGSIGAKGVGKKH